MCGCCAPVFIGWPRRKTNDRLLGLLDEVDCTGKQIHDANVVATMLVHGIETLVTGNRADFTRFEGMIRVVGLGR